MQKQKNNSYFSPTLLRKNNEYYFNIIKNIILLFNITYMYYIILVKNGANQMCANGKWRLRFCRM